MLPWTDDYPDPERLRAEVDAMVDVAAKEILSQKRKHLTALYHTGSSLKPWHSPVDYVPERSDVDIHLLFSHDTLLEDERGIAERLAMAERIEQLYRRRVEEPLHLPKLELVEFDKLLRTVRHVDPPPRNAIRILYGELPEIPRRSAREVEAGAREALRTLHGRLKGISVHASYETSSAIQETLSDVESLVSHTLGDLLLAHGLSREESFGMSRSVQIDRIPHFGYVSEAGHAEQFYRHLWRLFLAEENAARDAVAAGVEFLESVADGWTDRGTSPPSSPAET